MAYGGQFYGEAAYGGSLVALGDPDYGGTTVADFDAVYFWARTGAIDAYGEAAYGGRSTTSYPSAGLFAAPDPDTSVVTVPVWWAFASLVTLTRVDVATGERTPVRDSPITMPAGSRRNPASNPKASDTTTGHAAGTNTTLTRLTGLTTPFPRVTTGFRATATAAGGVAVAFSLDPVAPSDTTIALLVRALGGASGIGLSVAWYNAASTLLTTTTHPVPAAVVTAATTGWAQATVTVGGAPVGAVTGVVSITGSGLAAAGMLDFTARITAVGSTVGEYFDGDYPGSAWTGTPGLSYSDQSPIVSVVDAECPLDVPVRYELTSGTAAGFVASSQPVTLPGDRLLGTDRRRCLLTHPGRAQTIPVWIEAAPEVTRPIEQGTFKVIGRRRPVVISDPRRGADTGELTLVAETFEERDRLLAMLDDGSPLLLRAPAAFGWPPLWWLSIGSVVISPVLHYAPLQHRRITVSVTEVDRPSAATRALVA